MYSLFNFFLIPPLPPSPHEPFSTQLGAVTAFSICLSQSTSLLPLSMRAFIPPEDQFICLGRDLARCLSWPQRIQSPMFMRRWCSAGVNWLSGPRKLTVVDDDGSTQEGKEVWGDDPWTRSRDALSNGVRPSWAGDSLP